MRRQRCVRERMKGMKRKRVNITSKKEEAALENLYKIMPEREES